MGREILNLSKEKSIELVNLRKEQIVDLVKKDANLDGLISRVGLVLDFSGSMSGLYRDGTVQAIIDRVLPLAMQFDDNGEMEIWIFENGYRRLEPVNINNYYGYVKDRIIGKYDMGGTSYSPVMYDIKKYYIDEEPEKLPNYMVFITDGDCTDRRESTQTIKDLSRYPIFWNFIGIGNDSMSFLEELDTMDGRVVDNAGFFKEPDINKTDDTELYAKLLEQYPEWLRTPEVQEMINGNYPNPAPKKKGFFGRLFG